MSGRVDRLSEDSKVIFFLASTSLVFPFSCIYFCVYVCTCMHASCVNACEQSTEEDVISLIAGVIDSLTCLMWMLGSKLWSSAREAIVFNC